jgi:hypothetical protein
MWRILRQTGIAPPGIRGAEDDTRMVTEAGVGFLDVGCGALLSAPCPSYTSSLQLTSAACCAEG